MHPSLHISSLSHAHQVDIPVLGTFTELITRHKRSSNAVSCIVTICDSTCIAVSPTSAGQPCSGLIPQASGLCSPPQTADRLQRSMPSISIFRPTAAEKASLPLPNGVIREFVHTPSGDLELLCAEPSQPQQQRKTPIFFAHGGCGSAYVWLEWMQYFALRHDVPCYAVSLHASHSPTLLIMT